MLRNTTFTPKALALAIGVICTQTALQSQAQEAPDLRLEEVIVTAQKISESLQDVPISVSTISGYKLAAAGIENIEDLTSYLPNIHFTESGLSTQLRVRGIGSDNSQGFEQSVGMYVDGIYYGRAQLFRTPLMDMARVELLRGPQSTLFGKNSVAGALNLTTAAPTEEWEGKLTASREFENEQDEINAMISGPLSDSFRARIALRTYQEDGYFYNSYKEIDEPYTKENAARVTLDWTPTDSLSFIFKAEKNEFETQGRAIEITKDVRGSAATRTFSGTLSVLSLPTFESEQDYVRQTNTNEVSDTEITNFTLTSNYDFNDYTLTFVTGKLAFNYDEVCDCDFTPSDFIETNLSEDYDQFSQEIRITSPLGERFEWIAGLFYQDYEQTYQDSTPFDPDNELPIPLSLGPLGQNAYAFLNTGAAREFEQESKAYAMFGRVKWNITDQFNIVLGARQTWEEKTSSKRMYLYFPSNGMEINAGTVGAPTAGALGGLYEAVFLLESEALRGHNLSGKRNESPFDPLIIAEYNFSDDVMTYASFTTGSKAGGFDPRSNNTANYEFSNENAAAFELGIKTTLADGRVELNAALYRTDYKDLQISQFDGGVGFNVGNAKETRVQGLELDGRWLISDGLTAAYGLSWLDFEYRDFKNGNCYQGQTPDGIDLDGDNVIDSCDYTGKRGVYTPKLTTNLSLDYLTAITDSVNFIGFIDYQRVGSHNVHVSLDPQGEIDAYGMLNMRIGVEGDYWAVGILGKNLLDKSIISYSSNAPLSGTIANSNTYYSFVRRPKTIALEATIKF